MALPELTVGMGVVFALIVVALALFVWEPVPVDVTAIGVMVTLMVLEPWTGIAATASEGLAGFASPATVTVLAMFVLSDGVQRTGLIQRLGRRLASFTGTDERRQLGATVGLVAPISGFVNNTAAVALLLPMVTDLAHDGQVSPSKLLLPLSYASMFGGMLTLIGTSTNILASELSARLLDHPFSMFEFTHLGVLVSLVGTAYLLTVGRWLVPARVPVRDDLTEEFAIGDYLTEVVVREDSPLIGSTVAQALGTADLDVDVIELIRDDEVFLESLSRRVVRPGDVFAVRAGRDELLEVLDAEGLDLLPNVDVTEAELEAAEEGQNLAEVVVAPGSRLVGRTLTTANFRHRYDATALALRRGPDLVRERLEDVRLRVGDTLLVQGPAHSIERLGDNRDFIVAAEVDHADRRRNKTLPAVGIVAAVVGLAALGVLPIVVAALGGAVAMVATGCLRPTEVYDAVQWDVVFLLAGVIPLGIALEETGGAELIAELVVAASVQLPDVAVLGLLYVVTALLTNVVSNNASVVLMIPVAIRVARDVGGNPFAFVLAVTFAASTAFMTPVGYQTNLFVYGPGGYRFTDYLRLGAPLQALFAVVTTLGIAFFWPV